MNKTPLLPGLLAILAFAAPSCGGGPATSSGGATTSGSGSSTSSGGTGGSSSSSSGTGGSSSSSSSSASSSASSTSGGTTCQWTATGSPCGAGSYCNAPTCGSGTCAPLGTAESENRTPVCG